MLRKEKLIQQLTSTPPLSLTHFCSFVRIFPLHNHVSRYKPFLPLKDDRTINTNVFLNRSNIRNDFFTFESPGKDCAPTNVSLSKTLYIPAAAVVEGDKRKENFPAGINRVSLYHYYHSSPCNQNQAALRLVLLLLLLALCHTRVLMDRGRLHGKIKPRHSRGG